MTTPSNKRIIISPESNFKSGPTVTKQGDGFVLRSDRNDLESHLKDSLLKDSIPRAMLTKTETYSPIELSKDMSGTVGAIVIGAGSNSTLVASFVGKPFVSGNQGNYSGSGNGNDTGEVRGSTGNYW